MSEYELVLDGNDIPEKEFIKKFIGIVGCSYDDWIRKPNIKRDGGGEWYEYRDDIFVLGGTAYSAPKLYKSI